MSSLTEAEISSRARAKWWGRRIRLGGGGGGLFFLGVGAEGDGEVGERWGSCEGTGGGGGLGSVEVAGSVDGDDPGGEGGFDEVGLESDADAMESERVPENADTAAQALDIEEEGLGREPFESCCGEDGDEDLDGDGSAAASISLVSKSRIDWRPAGGGCGDDGEGELESFFTVVAIEELLAASYSSLTQDNAAATHTFFRSLPEYSGVSKASIESEI